MTFSFQFVKRLGIALGVFLLIVYGLISYGVQFYARHYHGLEIKSVAVSWGGLDLKDIRGIQDRLKIQNIRIDHSFSLLTGVIDGITIDDVQFMVSSESSNSKEIPRLDKIFDSIPMDVAKIEVSEISLKVANPMDPTTTFIFKGSMDGYVRGGEKSRFRLKLASTENNELVATYEKGVFSIDMDMKNIQLPSFLMPISMKAHMEQNEQVPLKFSAAFYQKDDVPFLEMEGSMDQASAGQMTFLLSDLSLHSQILPLGVWGVPALEKISSYAVKLSGKGGVSWGDNLFSPYGEIHLREGGVVYQNIEAKGIKVSLPLEQIWPQTKVIQNVYVEKITSPLMNIEALEFGLDVSENALKLNHIKGKAWNGILHLSGIQFVPMPADQLVSVALENISVQPLVDHLELKNITAQGALNGDIPVHLYEDGSISVDGGVIKSSESGYVAYQWDMGLVAENENLKLAAKALQNFTYEQATLTIEKQRHQEPELVLDIKGKNPRLLEGRSFEFKINLSGKILEALESMIQTFQADMKDLSKIANN
ncbi:MAG: YdbH domain-containing protein [Alphaproteobacteria bacterium]|nr:YdbH domain-containing protein [Alphaproteobacteria bacterium]